MCMYGSAVTSSKGTLPERAVGSSGSLKMNGKRWLLSTENTKMRKLTITVSILSFLFVTNITIIRKVFATRVKFYSVFFLV